MMVSFWRVAPEGVNWSWTVRGIAESPSSTVLLFCRNWTWIAACVRKYNDIEQISNFCFLILCVLIMQQNNLLCINYPHSPSSSRMVTVIDSRPGTKEAGAVALPEMTKLSVPSTRKSSITSTTRLWTLLSLVPWHNVNLWKTRWKSLFSASRVEECNSEWYKIIHSLTEIYCDL